MKQNGPKKSRFDGLDVAAMTAHCRRKLLGHKLANVYDGDAVGTTSDGSTSSGGKGTYIFKLANPNSSAANAAHPKERGNHDNGNEHDNGSGNGEETNRAMLLLESGTRFHVTSYFTSGTAANSSGGQPSPFAMKLRKHLRNLRLENVTQLGNLDRVVDFRFGSGREYCHHVLLELYGQGNIILTDGGYVILALLRVHEYASAGTGKNSGGGDKGDKGDVGSGAGGSEGSGGEVKVRVGNVYPVTYATTLEVVKSGDNKDNGNDDNNKDDSDQIETITVPSKSLLQMNGEQACEWAKQQLETYQLKITSDAKAAPNAKLGKKKKMKKGNNNKASPAPEDNAANGTAPAVLASANLKMLLLKPTSGVFHYGPSLIEHCILTANLDPHRKFTVQSLTTDIPIESWTALVESLRDEGSKVIDNFNTGDGKGYILYRPKPIPTAEHEPEVDKSTKTTTTTTIPHSDKLFLEFQPHLLQQHANIPHLTYDTFSSAVDQFFSLLEGQKRALRAEAAASSTQARLTKIRTDQRRRVEALYGEMERLKTQARLVEIHADDVDKVLGVLNSALESGMDWEALEQLVAVEKHNGNPIALLVHQLVLKEEVVVLSLPDTANWDPEGSHDDDDGGDGGGGGAPPIIRVRVSLKESAHGNARRMYDSYRASKEKSQKTAEASEMALKAAEEKAMKQLAELQKKKNIHLNPMAGAQKRTQHWFEKFHWFVTSDNYLVLGGRDAQQNEMLVKRYLRPGDAYLHADVHGAASCILRAKRRRKTVTKGKSGSGSVSATEVLPLSEQALREAGNFTICRSSAWSSRMVTSAWWVESHQVSKTAPTGEYLTVGSFMVRGKKNFLPASQLEMGLGVLFRLGDESSISRHEGERRDFMLLGRENDDVLDDGGGDDFLDDGFPEDSFVKKVSPVDNGLNGGKIISLPVSSEREEKIDNDDVKEAETSNDYAESTYDRSLGENGDMGAFLRAGTKEKNDTDKLDDDELMERLKRNKEEEHKNENVNEKKNSSVDSKSEPKKKKGLSARDRKLIKRYGSLEAAEEALEALRIEEEEKREASQASKKNLQEQSVPKAKTSNNSRGKKAKMKKIAKKYADQDDEDRELALLALQGGEKDKKNKKYKGVKASAAANSSVQLKAAAETTALLVRDAREVVDKLPKDVQDVLAECVTVKSTDRAKVDENDSTVRWDKLDAEVLEQIISLESLEVQMAAANRLRELSKSSRIDNFSASLAGIVRTIKKYGHEGIALAENDVGTDTKQRKTKAEKAAEQEAWREILAEDGIIEDNGEHDEGPVDDRAEIGKLTGKPVAEDLILYAIPVCAPYQTLAQYKYRVKLTPGSQKRGKASKQCLEMFLKSDDNGTNREANKRYLELIKLVNDNEWVQSICGDVKISAAGASKVTKKQKAGRKKGKKN